MYTEVKNVDVDGIGMATIDMRASVYDSHRDGELILTRHEVRDLIDQLVAGMRPQFRRELVRSAVAAAGLEIDGQLRDKPQPVKLQPGDVVELIGSPFVARTHGKRALVARGSANGELVFRYVDDDGVLGTQVNSNPTTASVRKLDVS